MTASGRPCSWAAARSAALASKMVCFDAMRASLTAARAALRVSSGAEAIAGLSSFILRAMLATSAMVPPSPYPLMRFYTPVRSTSVVIRRRVLPHSRK